MDGNKDEALRCIEVAEKYIKEKNKDKAQKFLNKAEKLYPTKRAQDLLLQVFIMPDNVEEVAPKVEKPIKKSEPSPQRVSYTVEQLNLVKRVRACKDYYEILGCSKDSDDVELKKAYRKFALQLHPDKNSAPGADEAFKAVGNAFAILTDPEKRKQYDLYGETAVKRPPRARRDSYSDFTRGFEADINPEELFNMFFGPGFGGSSTFVRRGGARWQRQGSGLNTEFTRDQTNNGMSTFVQLLPIIVAILLSMISSFFISDPAYSLSPNNNNKYPVTRYTQNYKFPYYVKENFHTEYQGSVKRLEMSIEDEHISNLKLTCYREHTFKEQSMWKARNFNSYDMMEQAKKITTPACDKLNSLRLKG